MQNPGASRREPAHGTEDREFNFFPGATLEEKPLWAELYESVRDALFPAKLPPLELTSTPIPVPDRLAAKTNPWAVGTATVVNGGILAIVLCLGLKAAINQLPKPLSPAHMDISDLNIFAPQRAQAAGGGGGGGSNSLTDPMRGRTPRFEITPILAPEIPVVANPKLAVDPAIAVPAEIKLPENETMPNIGVHNSSTVTLAYGQGIHSGIGTGADGGDGPDKGSGFGPGSDRGIGGEVYVPGGAVSAPVPIVAPEAEFSDEARREKYQGVCLISLIVDAHGNPQSLRVVRPLGMGLDEKALEAIRKYRFRPAMKDKKPVAARITIEVDFRLY